MQPLIKNMEGLSVSDRCHFNREFLEIRAGQRQKKDGVRPCVQIFKFLHPFDYLHNVQCVSSAFHSSYHRQEFFKGNSAAMSYTLSKNSKVSCSEDVIPAAATVQELNLEGKLPNRDLLFEVLSKASELKKLNLQSCSMEKEGLRNILQTVRRTGCILKELNISNTSIDDRVVVEEVVRFSDLRCLYLDHTKISDKSVQALSKMPKLSTISIRHCPNVTDAGYCALIESHDFSTIALDDMGVSNDVMKALAKRPRLKKVSLRNCPDITDAGYCALAQSKSIEHIVIDISKLSNTALQAIMCMPNWRCIAPTDEG
jgi:hypothetical protein